MEANEYVVPAPIKGWRIAGTRVSFASVVHGYLSGERPESIQENFPSLTVEQVYGAIAFYLKNRPEADAYMAQVAEAFEELRLTSERENAVLLARLRAARAGALR